ncbi:uncharacterized protein LOC124138542 [Haliotis rufescens]|uniref:uncharacterized protein LOC124138542 n=1 Tax=Haliotis rufescens TaxID=6454 RepID=UPI001EB00777|nr:uncharacterized protein LOC124138542 [Haliotis rufescens]
MSCPSRPTDVSCPKGYAMFANTTLSSSPDENGCCYWSSFDLTSFAKGQRLKAYVGLLNGKGPRSGDHTVIKIFRDETGTETMCNIEIKKSKTAQSFVVPFTGVISPEFPIHFTSLLKACMDDVCLMKNALSSGRKLCKQEWVLIEEKIGKNFQNFVSHSGKANPTTATKILEAFVHFTYHNSAGKLVVCGLEGSSERGKTCLKTPTIHSVTKEYGGWDLGEKGIKMVFANHVCNDLCREFITPRHFSDRAEPSAPFDPDLAYGGEFDVSQMPRYDQFSPYSFGQYFNFPSPPPYQMYPDLRLACAFNQKTTPYQPNYHHPISA